MNESAARLAEPVGGFNDFLDAFMIEEIKGGVQVEEKTAITLLDKINQILKEEKGGSPTFRVLLAKLYLSNTNSHEIQEATQISNQISEEETISIKSAAKYQKKSRRALKFEIHVGFIRWGENEEEDVIISLNNVSILEEINKLQIMHKNKDMMLASISHGLNTPLNGIRGMLQAAQSCVNDASVEKFLSTAMNSTNILFLMINDILDISLMEKGSLRLKSESVNVRELVDSVLPLFESQIKNKGLEFKLTNECQPDACVKGDFMRLQQVLFNLLSNSYKFTKEGTIHLRIYEEKCSESEMSLDKSFFEDFDEIVFSLADTGSGIKEENFPKLFTMFGKFEKTGNETGAGLGLLLSQKLTKIMNGNGIQFKSEYGKGSVFWFNLRKDFELLSPKFEANLTKYNKITKQMLRDETGKISLPKKSAAPRILVVDDDQVNHFVAESYLKSIGTFELARAFNGAEALKIILESARNRKFFNLILMDINMPIMDGYQASREISLLKEKRIIPELLIVAITANIEAESKLVLNSSGVNDVILKPINFLEFKKIVLESLEKLDCASDN